MLCFGTFGTFCSIGRDYKTTNSPERRAEAKAIPINKTRVMSNQVRRRPPRSPCQTPPPEPATFNNILEMSTRIDRLEKSLKADVSALELQVKEMWTFLARNDNNRGQRRYPPPCRSPERPRRGSSPRGNKCLVDDASHGASDSERSIRHHRMRGALPVTDVDARDDRGHRRKVSRKST